MIPEPNDKPNERMKAYDIYNAWVSGRVAHVWRVSLALWSALALLTGILLTNKIEAEKGTVYSAVTGLIIVAVFYGYWLYVQAKRTSQDVEQMAELLKPHLEERLNLQLPSDLPDDKSRCCLKKYISWWFQGLVTAVFVIVLLSVFLGDCDQRPIADSGSDDSTEQTEAKEIAE